MISTMWWKRLFPAWRYARKQHCVPIPGAYHISRSTLTSIDRVKFLAHCYKMMLPAGLFKDSCRIGCDGHILPMRYCALEDRLDMCHLQAHHERLATGGNAESQSAVDADMQQPQQPCSKPYLEFLLTAVKGFGGCLELKYIRRCLFYALPPHHALPWEVSEKH